MAQVHTRALAVQVPPPVGLPPGRYPDNYQAARAALDTCARVDECAAWANRAHALASYAKQAKDETLKNYALRIHARAVRRCGELLAQVPPAGGRRTDRGRRGPPTRGQVARAGGLSRGQMRAALQVSQVPAEAFEIAVESEAPPTVTRLAAMGVTRPGRWDRPSSARLLFTLQQLVGLMAATTPEEVTRHLSARGRALLGEQLNTVLKWCAGLTPGARPKP
jgi:hypothetical protein